MRTRRRNARKAAPRSARCKNPEQARDEALLRLRLAIVLSPDIPWNHKLRLGPAIAHWHDTSDRDLADRLRAPLRAIPNVRRAVIEAAPLVDDELASAQRHGLTLMGPEHPMFPQRLFDLDEPPLVLSMRCESEPVRLFDAPSIAMVGPRNADPHGLEAATRFASDFASAGITVVSGFARGVDIASHRAAAAIGRTIAVVGCGLCVPYPNHYHEAGEIVRRGGALLSEFPLHCEPQRWHFPLRNRLIAALGDATLVVQASKRSGSLLTAHSALELGRDVWALPGRLADARSQGANLLLRDGAGMALCPRDLIESLPRRPAQDASLSPEAASNIDDPELLPGESTSGLQSAPATTLSAEAALLLARIGVRAATADQLAKRCRMTISQALAALGELEVEGRVQRRDANTFRAVRD